MNRNIYYYFLLFFLFSSSIYATKYNGFVSLQRIKKVGGNIYITSKIDYKNDIYFWFKKCMYNDLFTFYRVGVSHGKSHLISQHPDNIPEKILNIASSDNIGPFEIENGGWCGGNHSFSMKNRTIKTASTVAYKIIADGKELSKDTTMLVHSIRISVVNHIQNPRLPQNHDLALTLPNLFCIEYVDYDIYQNSIQVSVRHQYKNQIPITINKYYGMQSMFNNEKEILTVDGKYFNWTPISKITRFNKKDYPHFRWFLEQNDIAFQSTFLFKYGLGIHKELKDSDVIFIGNSYGKSYHKLISNKKKKNGDSDGWKGVYTWNIINKKEARDLFIYRGKISDKLVLYIIIKNKINKKVVFPIRNNHTKLNIIYRSPGIKIKKCCNKKYQILSNKPGGIIISLSKNNNSLRN
ncbi:MAG: hypothetical protein LKF06_07410 [Prevotella sp.]|jgi:hypothetical protein|nr:hypothetical protein [Prevotella sp.]